MELSDEAVNLDQQLKDAIIHVGGLARESGRLYGSSGYDLVDAYMAETGLPIDGMRPGELRKYRYLELLRAREQIGDYYSAPWLRNVVEKIIQSMEEAGGLDRDDSDEENPPESAGESYERASGRPAPEPTPGDGEGEGQGPGRKEPGQGQPKSGPPKLERAQSDKDAAKDLAELLEELRGDPGKGKGAGVSGSGVEVSRVATIPAHLPKEYIPILDDLSPSADLLDTSGMAGDSAWEVNVGNLRVFETVEEDKTNLVIAVDCSSSVGHACWGNLCPGYGMSQEEIMQDALTGGLEWAAANILADAARKVEIYAYRNYGGSKLNIAPVQKGHRVPCNWIAGGTPDDTMLEFLATRIRGNIENTLAVFICDGGPGNAHRTAQVARELYQAGMRFIYIVVGDSHHRVPYPADLVIRLREPADLLKLGPAIMRIREGYIA